MKIKSAGAFSTLAFLLSSSCGLISTKASAQFLLNLSPGVASVVQGGSQNFTAQLTMGVSAPETYNLVSVAWTVTGLDAANLSVDDAAFFGFLPYTLAPGESYSEFITLNVSSLATPGL